MTEDNAHPPLHVRLGGKLYRLCPTIDDLSAVEKKLSTSILDLAKKLSAGIMSLEELIVILEHSVESEARKLHVKELMLHSGITHITQAITSLFMHIFKGSDHHISTTGITKEDVDAMAQKFPDK